MNIKLSYKYIMHDVDQWTYRLAKVRVQDDEIRNEAQSSGISTDVTYYRRKIEEAVAQLRTILRNRLSTKNATAADTLDATKTEWDISLADGKYSCDAQAITDLMHKYVVRSVIADWAVTYAPDSVAVMAQETEAIRQQLLTEVYNRRYPTLEDYAKYTITAESNNSSYGTVTGGGEYGSGTTITLTATPTDAELYQFSKWDDDDTTNPRTVTVSEDKTYTAIFTTI